jgi:hypothetical protein
MLPRVISSPSLHTSSSSSTSSSSIHLNSLASAGDRTPDSYCGNNEGGMKVSFSSINNIRRATSLIGRAVRISQGPYKGYIGIVKDATESTCKIKLHAKCQTMTVDRSRILSTTYRFFSLFRKKCSIHLLRNVPRQPGEMSNYFTTSLYGCQISSYAAFV